MNYKDLFRLKTLLGNNPNIARLSNKIKLKLVSLEDIATKELKILEQTETIVLNKYNLSKDDNGSYEPSILVLKEANSEEFKKFQKELGDLQEQESEINVDPFLSEDEYCTLTDRQEIKKWDGSKCDFYYALSDLVFLRDLFMKVEMKEDPKQ